MISGLMKPEKQQPGNEAAPQPRSADMYDALAWLELHKKKLGLFALLAVLIGFGVATWRYFDEQKELKASTALLELRPVLTPSTNVPAPQPSALLKVAEQFSGTHAGQRAQYLAAAALFQEGNYAEAETQFGKFIRENPASAWIPEAAYSQAAALEAQNKTNEAMAAYQQIATAHANSAVADDAKIAMARIYESRNEPQQALRIYNELAPATPGALDMGHPEALQRKEALLRAHPELQAEPTAAAPSSTNTVLQLAPQTTTTSAPPAAQTNATAPPAEGNASPAPQE